MTTKEQVIELAKQVELDKELFITTKCRERLERFATLVRNAALDEVAALGRIGDRTKNPALIEFVGEIYELKEPTP